MAKISSIITRNLKGTTVNQPLTGTDVFVGPNGIGKTTRLQAVQIAMLGYVPGNGKRPADTYKYASDERNMAVGLQLDGFSFTRQLDRTMKLGNKGMEFKISESLSVSPARGERTETEKKGRVAAEVGSFPVMLDFAEFTSLTDNKRRDFIYSLSAGQSDDWNREKVEKYLEGHLLTMELEVNEPDLYRSIQKAIESSLKDYTPDMNIDEGLQAVRGYVTEELAVWKRKAADAEGAIRQLNEQKNKYQVTDRDIDKNKAELAHLRQELIKTETQLARDTERKKAIDRRTARLAELDELIANLQKQNNAPTEQIDAIDQEIAALQGQMDHTSDQSEYEALSSEKTECQGQLDEFRKTVASLHQEGTKLDTEITNIQHTLDTIDRHKGVCVIQHQIKCDKDFSSYVEKSQQEIGKRREKCAEINAGIAEAEEAGRELIAQINEIEQKMSGIMGRTQKRQQANEARGRRIQELNNQKSSVLAAERKRQGDLGAAYFERDNLQSQPVEAIAPLDLLEVQRDNLRNEISELDAKLEEQEKARNSMNQVRQSMLSNREAEYKAKTFKLLNDALGPKGIQGEIVKTMLEPMRAEIEHNLWMLGVHRQVFFQTESDTGQEIFQFGWEQNEQRRNYDALSTGQQLIFLIAFLVAVIERANPPIKVLALDNIEHLDRTNQRFVLEGLYSMKHRLDNIILAGVIDPDVARETGWTVHELVQEGAFENAEKPESNTTASSDIVQ